MEILNKSANKSYFRLCLFQVSNRVKNNDYKIVGDKRKQKQRLNKINSHNSLYKLKFISVVRAKYDSFPFFQYLAKTGKA